MSQLAAPLERLIRELSKLPSIGRKTAQRLAFHLLVAPVEDARALAEDELCPICSDNRRDRAILCVVEEPSNLVGFERTGAYRGLYHVLGGALSPLKDVGPDELRVRELMARLGSGGFDEVILATNPDVEGEATAVYLSRLIKPLGIRTTRLAQGLPAGGDLEFTDDLTLTRALEGRRSY